MRASLTDMASHSLQAEGQFVGGAVVYCFLAPIVTAGLGAIYLWWQGAEMMLGQLLAVGAAGAILGFWLWHRRNRRAAR